MRLTTRLPGVSWVAIGLVVGLLFAPAAAVAASSLVRIVGSNGKKAEVTAANQLQTAAAGPSQFRTYRELGVATTCKPVFKAPKRKGYVMTGATLNVYQNTTPGIANWIGLFTDPVCEQAIVLHNAPGVGALHVPFEPGFAVKAGASIYTMTLGNVRGEIYLQGYLVPKAAVPATTVNANRPGAAALDSDSANQ